MKSLLQVTSKEGNYKNYRTKIEASPSPPLVLFLDPFLEDLSYVENSNQDIGKGGIINFTKHRQMARMIRHVLTYQNGNYADLKADTQIQEYILNSQALEDDQLKKLSMMIEAPASFLK